MIQLETTGLVKLFYWTARVGIAHQNGPKEIADEPRDGVQVLVKFSVRPPVAFTLGATSAPSSVWAL
jgi:hypothetical protein